jgi:hypothetical protein
LGNSVTNLIKIIFNYRNLEQTQDNDIAYYEIEINKKIVKVFRIIHPTAFGGNRENLYNKLVDLKNKIL